MIEQERKHKKYAKSRSCNHAPEADDSAILNRKSSLDYAIANVESRRVLPLVLTAHRPKVVLTALTVDVMQRSTLVAEEDLQHNRI